MLKQKLTLVEILKDCIRKLRLKIFIPKHHFYDDWNSNTNCVVSASCASCDKCAFCVHCFECTNCTSCTNCTCCFDCNWCVSCSDCYGCCGIKEKQYVIYNVQKTKEEYEREVAGIKTKNNYLNS